jgi:hypothetical protein
MTNIKTMPDMELVLTIEQNIKVQMVTKFDSVDSSVARAANLPLFAEMDVRYPNGANLPADVLAVAKRF